MEYVNYHKHDTMSSIGGMPDSATKQEEYIQKAVEYGHTTYFTTNHGNMGDIFEAYSLCEKYGIACYAGLEGYIVADPAEKDKRNYHIIIIPRTNNARKKVNVINSNAHISGYYYKPRIGVQDLLTLEPDDVYITTACEAGILKDADAYRDIFVPLYKHFRNSLLLEVQNHNTDNTKAYAKRALELHNRHGLRLVAANDSHAVDAVGLERRRQLLLGKKISYGDKDTYVLDYPDYDTMFDRFVKQDVLSESEIREAIENTLIFKECEPLQLDYEIKMPTIYPELTPRERVDELKRIVTKNFKQVIIEDEITKEELPKYKEGLREEMKIIEDTNDVCHSADYFLLNTKLVELATTKYGGCLTRTGRGSCGSFYTNRVLGLTHLDRFRIALPSFPERFMSTARLIEQRALPDIDMNVVTQEPFVLATRELLGEHGCYPMIAYGTMKESEAFRNVCRSHGLEFSEFNEVGKEIDKYRDNPKWKDYIEEAQQYIGIEVSASVHPCAHILSDKDLLEEYGVVRCGDAICVMITSAEADQFKVLKNDYLVVSVWKLIEETCKLAKIPIPSLHQLMKKIAGNEVIWDMVTKGLTSTINQTDTDNGRQQAMRFKPTSFEEMAMLAAAIRPSFDSWREKFLNREDYSTGSDALDGVLNMTHHYILYQENLMQYFEWLGVTPAESIGLIKKISKKKIKPEDFANLEDRLREGWVKQNHTDSMFDETWEMIQSCMAYGFCSLHGAATAGDACYGLYLKAYYPFEYFTVCFNTYEKDQRTTNMLKEELKHFNINFVPIKFGFSQSEYTFNKEKREIYKGLSGIKFLNKKVSRELYALGQKKYDSYIDVLEAIQHTSCNSRQLEILIKLDYFNEYGDINELLKVVDLFNELYNAKVLALDKIVELRIPTEILVKQGKTTEKQYRDFDGRMLLEDVCEYYRANNMMPKTTILDRIRYQLEYQGYIQVTIQSVKPSYAYVQSITGKSKRHVTLYRLNSGEIETVSVRAKQFDQNPFEENNIINTIECSEENKWKRNNETGEFYQIDEKEMILTKWQLVKG